MTTLTEAMLKLIASQSVTKQGAVSRINRREIRVQTSAGMIVALRSPGDATNYVPGDRVRVRDGLVVGRARSGAVRRYSV